MRICFVGNVSRSFVKNDYETLKHYFDVDYIKPPKTKLEWLKYLLILPKKVRQSDLTFSWFAGCYSAFVVFFSKLFRKKSIVVVGGYDAAYLPEYCYGAFTNLKEKIPAIYIYKNANKILVVSQALKEEIIKNAKVSGKTIEFLPTGFNPDYWRPSGKKEHLVLTVAGANTILRVKIKGLETLVRAASHIPSARFILISVTDAAKEYLEKIASPNVEFIGYLSQKELLAYYQKAKVYTQLSLREGLPTALCEAMLCECIPVGSNAIGVQSVIGDTGYSADYGNEQATADRIQQALVSGDERGKKARERIIQLFHENKKKERLQHLILEMTQL